MPDSNKEEALNSIFSAISDAIAEKRNNKIALDQIDKTLDALFDAVNQANIEADKVKIPDFKKLLSD